MRGYSIMRHAYVDRKSDPNWTKACCKLEEIEGSAAVGREDVDEQCVC